MAGIGDDIKAVTQELGASFRIKRGGVVIGTEKLNFVATKQGSKPFNLEHLANAQLYYDTMAVQGDVLQIIATGESFFLMLKNSEIFEDAVIASDCMLYKTGDVATFSRVTAQSRNMQTYEPIEIFVPYAAGVEVLVYDKLYGSVINEASSIGNLSIRINEMMVSSSIGVKTNDRVALSATEYYKVEQIETRRFSGAIWVCSLTEDSRG
jgi:hypothetical protein